MILPFWPNEENRPEARPTSSGGTFPSDFSAVLRQLFFFEQPKAVEKDDRFPAKKDALRKKTPVKLNKLQVKFFCNLKNLKKNPCLNLLPLEGSSRDRLPSPSLLQSSRCRR